jgi:hypothetical protein
MDSTIVDGGSGRALVGNVHRLGLRRQANTLISA